LKQQNGDDGCSSSAHPTKQLQAPGIFIFPYHHEEAAPLLLSLIFMCAGLRAGDTRATVINQQTNFKTGPQTEITLVASSTQTLEIERIEVFGVVSGEERKLEDARRRLEQAVDALGRVLRAYQIEYAALPAEPVLLSSRGRPSATS
jgi:hypothetical protein